MAHVFRFMVLLAVLLMPLGMTAPGQAHPATNMSMMHCPDPDSHHQHKRPFTECTMGCASALPAVDRIGEEAPPVAHIAVAPMPVRPLHGLHPETATPPPKLS